MELARGAEAILEIVDGDVVKKRPVKSYRLKELDEKLRKSRARREAKVLSKLAEAGVACPKLISEPEGDSFAIVMEHLDGQKVRDVLTSENAASLGKQIGLLLKKMHSADICHGDLTTSNMIFKDDTVYVIDFGLSFFSDKIEDKAVDLHLLDRTLQSKHHTLSEKCFASVLSTYSDKEVISWLENSVELRGRHKGKH